MWEREGRGRIGVEAYLTGRQRLEDNPYRSQSVPYVLFGGLVERRIGRVRVFVNVENLANVRQTHLGIRSFVQRAPSTDGGRSTRGRPLDGRVINGGVRLRF